MGATSPEGNRKVGVIWHTQGSGKSLLMAFYAGQLVRRPELQNPTIVVMTDRNDLDDQLFGTFSMYRDLIRQTPIHAENREDLQKALNRASGGVIFTTIQEFAPARSGADYPALTDRRNVVVIADEADGSHTVTATATDTIGQTTSDSVSVEVDNVDDPPSVSITSPTGGTVSGTVTITADASDDGGVTQVEFLVGGVSVGVDTNSGDGWSALWDTTMVADGSHTVTATATDTIGQTTSHSVNVTVDNSAPAEVHVGDLDGSSALANRGRWNATVTITVHDSSEISVSGVTVSGNWSGGAKGSSSCVTNASGQCPVTKSNIKANAGSATFTVSNLEIGTILYASGSNHDPDDDSNGTFIIVTKP